MLQHGSTQILGLVPPLRLQAIRATQPEHFYPKHPLLEIDK
jgi:hypothetical protein